jgi:hypothetical protein
MVVTGILTWATYQHADHGRLSWSIPNRRQQKTHAPEEPIAAGCQRDRTLVGKGDCPPAIRNDPLLHRLSVRQGGSAPDPYFFFPE